MRKLFGAFLTITASSLATVADAQRIQHTTNDFVPYPRQVANSSAANQHNGVFLQVVTFSGNVRRTFFSVGKTNTSHLSKSRVRLLRGHCLHLQANATFLRTTLKKWCLILRFLLLSRLSNQLVNCRHANELLDNSVGNQRSEKQSGTVLAPSVIVNLWLHQST